METVAVAIEGRQFANWQSLSIVSGLDVVQTISLSAPFEPDNPEFRELFRPFDFTPISIDVSGVRELTGTMVRVGPQGDADSTEVAVAGYSLPGVLGDCDPPASALPFEWKGVGLKTIAEAVCSAFGLDLDYRLVRQQGYSFVPDDQPFEKVAFDPLEQVKKQRGSKAIDETGKPWEFLAKLANMRGAVLSSSADGKLVIWKAAASGSPVASIEGGLPPLVAVTPQFRPQDYYSEVTGFSPAKRGHAGGKWTEQNELLTGRIRPFHFRIDDGEDADGPLATKSKLGRMYGAAAGFNIVGLPTWRSPSGDLWRPNTTIRLKAPMAMVYDYTDLLIRTVALHQTDKSETADLQVCFPWAFAGEVPLRFLWSRSSRT